MLTFIALIFVKKNVLDLRVLKLNANQFHVD